MTARATQSGSVETFRLGALQTGTVCHSTEFGHRVSAWQLCRRDTRHDVPTHRSA
jgi:hypothetical protein